MGFSQRFKRTLNVRVVGLSLALGVSVGASDLLVYPPIAPLIGAFVFLWTWLGLMTVLDDDEPVRPPQRAPRSE